MAVNASDLDAATLKRLGLADEPGAKKPRLSRAGSGGWDLACTACGYRPTSDATATKHAAAEDHCRFESVPE